MPRQQASYKAKWAKKGLSVITAFPEDPFLPKAVRTQQATYKAKWAKKGLSVVTSFPFVPVEKAYGPEQTGENDEIDTAELLERVNAVQQQHNEFVNEQQNKVFDTAWAGSISFDPPLQARIFSELGIMLATATNKWLVRQANAGRLDVLLVTRAMIAHEDKYQNPVFEFWVDLETQLQIVTENYETVLFATAFEKSASSIQLQVFTNWPFLVRNITSANYQHPDSIVLGAVQEIKTILQMLNAPVAILEAWHVLHCKVHQAMDDNQRAGRVSAVQPQYRGRIGTYVYRPREAPSRHYGGLADAEERMRLRHGSVLGNEAYTLPPSPAVPIWRQRREVPEGRRGIPKQS
ncbi:hypothetical protein LTR10_023243 [Elasticomyces elasticus]|uniref:Uncharacterized protein n=1 Tax=Exophiala sideris TaxID=1016849 RepID=A0ABR0J2K3_9EURO|nr:hypothetical protein LTR10_023243 [Elasticomyces elasticus]KAK5024735.1 hypothetical protein LTS07_008581 [Exophiala sideris]KAK5030828.1 hypothetical protein LTR13_008182 [Exophiala sideris]KAK5054370.1 hypothetical protein LTR69_008985 [Exophiala sideris]KAK5179770.1 hypothetical protein LTR44_007938 [Eurotiomycetes sp. CCFEE 6388]